MRAEAATDRAGCSGAVVLPSRVWFSAPPAGSRAGAFQGVVAKLVAVVALGVLVEAEATFQTVGSVHSGARGAPYFPGPRQNSPPRPVPRAGAGRLSDWTGRGGASFCAPPLIPHSRAPPFDGAPPGAPYCSITGTVRICVAYQTFYGYGRGFYGCDHVFCTLRELPEYDTLLTYTGCAHCTREV